MEKKNFFIFVFLVITFHFKSFSNDSDVSQSLVFDQKKLGTPEFINIKNDIVNEDKKELSYNDIYRRKKKLTAEKLLHSSALIPLYGQIRKWSLGIDDYKKTLFFGLAFAGLISFYVYNHIKYVNSVKLSDEIHFRYYKRKMYTLSFIVVTSFLSVFDSYLSIYEKMSDFSDSLDDKFSENYF